MKRPFLNPSLRTIVRYILAIALLQVALVSIVAGQDLDTVTITGRVTDQNQAIIPGATVEAVLVKTGITRQRPGPRCHGRPAPKLSRFIPRDYAHNAAAPDSPGHSFRLLKQSSLLQR